MPPPKPRARKLPPKRPYPVRHVRERNTGVSVERFVPPRRPSR